MDTSAIKIYTLKNSAIRVDKALNCKESHNK